MPEREPGRPGAGVTPKPGPRRPCTRAERAGVDFKFLTEDFYFYFFFSLVFCLFSNKVDSSSSWPGTLGNLLPQPLKCGDNKRKPPRPALFFNA